MLSFLNGFLMTTFVSKPAEWVQTFWRKLAWWMCALVEILSDVFFFSSSSAEQWTDLYYSQNYKLEMVTSVKKKKKKTSEGKRRYVKWVIYSLAGCVISNELTVQQLKRAGQTRRFYTNTIPTLHPGGHLSGIHCICYSCVSLIYSVCCVFSNNLISLALLYTSCS